MLKKVLNLNQRNKFVNKKNKFGLLGNKRMPSIFLLLKLHIDQSLEPIAVKLQALCLCIQFVNKQNNEIGLNFRKVVHVNKFILFFTILYFPISKVGRKSSYCLPIKLLL